MKHTIIAITFEVNAQGYIDGRFSIPKEVRELLELRDGEEINLTIESSSGLRKFPKQKLSSGPEIYGEQISEHVKAGERITVTVSRL